MYLLGIIAFVSAFLMIALFGYLFAHQVPVVDDLSEEERDVVLENDEYQQTLLWRSGYILIGIFVVAIALIFTQSLMRYYG
ncbi:hypothetical protein [Kurthia massiliensis]|uniref:hypothetical protein n=1 Tax=Kurthia massiliensis TaxID=1033739 RepID=UPI000289DA01|nr:hypothetical protein [Kurthia massiliensis]